VLVLGIETSCDETAVAIVGSDRKIYAHEILSQIDDHTPYGGVVPEIAARAHLQHLDRLIRQAMQTANIGWDDLSAIAATAGPGLIGGLLVGATMAKAIAAARDLPFIAVNHLEAHALTARLTDDVAFPYMLLLVSGGHTQILLVAGVGQYARLGGTIDDAAGEAFDKVAKLLGLGFPGGPALSLAAERGDANRFSFSHPLQGRAGCDFSFSGLKTAARTIIHALPQPLSAQDRADVAASFQAIMARIMADRVKRALAMAPGATTLVVAGGVAANTAIRAALADMCTLHSPLPAGEEIRLIAPPAALCTDNAAMVAWVGIERLRLGLTNDLDFAPRPRWPLTELSDAA
jgi:N6-L-threonylcarbamoyladenine synthase